MGQRQQQAHTQRHTETQFPLLLQWQIGGDIDGVTLRGRLCVGEGAGAERGSHISTAPATKYTKSFLIILSLNAHRATYTHTHTAALFTSVHMFVEL